MRGSTALLALSLTFAACPGGGDTTTESTAAATTGDTTGAATTAVTSSATTGADTTGASTGATDPNTGATGTSETGGEPGGCGDPLPPDGGPCADGDQCSPYGNECVPFPYGFCIGGKWLIQQVFGHGEELAVCAGNCDPFPAAGDACGDEGSRCYDQCENACSSACKIYGCEGGVWRDLAVPTLPCLDCDGFCEFLVQADCANGPANQGACVDRCQQALAGGCGREYADTMACAGTAPEIVCDMYARPSTQNCSSIFSSYYLCVGE